MPDDNSIIQIKHTTETTCRRQVRPWQTFNECLTQISDICFILDNDDGQKIEFFAPSNDICSSWIRSIRANRAWLAQQEFEVDDEDWQDCSTIDTTVIEANNKKYVAGSLPTQGCSFSDTPAALERGWNFCSETTQGEAYYNQAQQ